MSARTDRQRVKEQADRITDALDNAIRHAQQLDVINDNRSEYINEKLPLLVTGMQFARDLSAHFKNGL